MRTTLTVRHLAFCGALLAAALATSGPAQAQSPAGAIQAGYQVDLNGDGRTAARVVVPQARCKGGSTFVAQAHSIHHVEGGSVIGGTVNSLCVPDATGSLVASYEAFIFGPSGPAVIDRTVKPADVVAIRTDNRDGLATVTVKNLTRGWHRRDSGAAPASDFYTVGADTSTGGRKGVIQLRNNTIDGEALGRADAQPNPPTDPCGALGPIENQLHFSVSVICGTSP